MTVNKKQEKNLPQSHGQLCESSDHCAVHTTQLVVSVSGVLESLRGSCYMTGWWRGGVTRCQTFGPGETSTGVVWQFWYLIEARMLEPQLHHSHSFRGSRQCAGLLCSCWENCHTAKSPLSVLKMLHRRPLSCQVSLHCVSCTFAVAFHMSRRHIPDI